MPGFEEEAFARAQQLHRSRERQSAQPRQETDGHREKPKPEPQVQKEAPPFEPVPEKPPRPLPKGQPNALETLFRDKDKSLIMLLLLLLTESSADPTLLFALMYLL
jgi:hypothetical protein